MHGGHGLSDESIDASVWLCRALGWQLEAADWARRSFLQPRIYAIPVDNVATVARHADDALREVRLVFYEAHGARVVPLP